MKNLTSQDYKRFFISFILTTSFIGLLFTIDYANSIAKGIARFFDNAVSISFNENSSNKIYKNQSMYINTKNTDRKEQKKQNIFFDNEYEIKVKGIDY